MEEEEEEEEDLGIKSAKWVQNVNMTHNIRDNMSYTSVLIDFSFRAGSHFDNKHKHKPTYTEAVRCW